MYYINAKPNESGDHGNPMGQPFEGSIALPDSLLSDYIKAMGFVIPTIENDSVVSLEVNQEALDAYLLDHPDQPEAETEPTTEERVAALEEAVAMADETAIDLYEAQLQQEETNAAQDEALIELYEMIGG